MQYEWNRPWGGAHALARPSVMNVGETERWASMAAAMALVAWAVQQRRKSAWWAAAASAALLYRAGTGHCPVYAAAGISTRDDSTKRALGGARGVHVDETIVIDRPLGEVYAFWRNLGNLPRVMRHVESVTTDGPRSHWVAKGPAGTTVEWDAEVIHEEPNKLIGWKSVDGATVASAGSVHFEPLADGLATLIRVRFQYEPPAGRFGAWVAGLSGEEPSIQVREDLQRLKAWMEGGASAPRHER